MLLPARAIWRLTGNDRARYLNGQVTQDIKTLPAGQSRYAAVISAKGRLQGDAWISATPDALLIDAPLELQESLGPRLERYIVADDAVLEDFTGKWQILHRLGQSIYPTSETSLAFPSRRFGLAGTDHWVPSDSSLPDPTLIESGLLEILRIENALPKWGAEMNENTLPPEVRLDVLATSYSKGCYIGQEVIARLKSIGHVNKHLCLLSSVSPEAPLPALPSGLVLDGKEVGQLTSACFSPCHQRPLALGIVARSSALAGNVLESAGHSWKIESLPS
jgi:folate-binding protein YgfZ